MSAIADLRHRHSIEHRALEAYCREACYTIDELDPDAPIKHLPFDELPFLSIYLSLLVREDRVYVPKSRQMSLTWVTLEAVSWFLARAPHQRWAWVTKKQEDGEAHVEERLKNGILAHWPPFLRDQFEFGRAKGHLILAKRNGKPWNSRLIVYPQGADQLRQYTHSGVVIDEAAFQARLGDMWRGMMPTRAGRGSKAGKLIVISSAKRGSFFHGLVGKKVREAVALARVA